MMETYLTPIHARCGHAGPVSPPIVRPAASEARHALVAPGDVFRHPREVLDHPQLSRAEKRAILASWASDACALENAPSLRCLTGCRVEPVPVDAVLGALAELDEAQRRGPSRDATGPVARRRPPRWRSHALRNPRVWIRRGGRDDDDPPPCPATILPAPRPRPPASTGARVLCVPA